MRYLAVNPTLVYEYPQTPVNDRRLLPLRWSLEKAGIKVRPNPIETWQFYGIVQARSPSVSSCATARSSSS